MVFVPQRSANGMAKSLIQYHEIVITHGIGLRRCYE